MAKQPYHLKTGQSGEQQLDNLDRTFGKTSREFLNHIGLSNGMRVLDVGCGIGNLSCWIANQVGKTGQVFAIDSDSKQLESAKQRTAAQGITNIIFEQADAHDLSKYKDQFDLSYCRWLLIHVKNPENVVKNMASTLCVGGVLACEVGDLLSSFYHPEFERYVYLQNKLLELFEKSGNDTNISVNIFKICKALAHCSFDVRLSQQVLHQADDMKSYTANFTLVLSSIAQALTEHQIMTSEDIAQIQQDLQTHPVDEHTLIYLTRMVQVWCKRLQ